MKNKKKIETNYPESEEIVSMCECTGLIPAPPANDTQAESYSDIYSIPEQRLKK